MNIPGAQKMLLLLCVGASLAHDLITPEKIHNIEEKLRVTEEILNELKRENEGMIVTIKVAILFKHDLFLLLMYV